MFDKTRFFTTRYRCSKKKTPVVNTLSKQGFYSSYFSIAQVSDGATQHLTTIPPVIFTKAPDASVIKVGKLSSLKDQIMAQRETLVADTKETINENKAEIFEVIPQQLTEENINVFLSYLADVFQKQQRRVLASYFAKPLFSIEEGNLMFTIPSKLIQTAIEENILWIKAEAQNKGLSILNISTQIDAAKVESYNPTTPQQHFESLAKEFPILEDFRQRFHLEIE